MTGSIPFMAAPLNTYTLLWAMTGHGESYDRDRFEYALRPFTLAAFVLHDPLEDLRFHRLMDQEFSRLDDETGDRFLFFAFAQPSESWHRRSENQSHYELVKGSTLPTLMTEDVGIVSNAIASAVGISLDSLPVLVVINPRDFSLIEVFSTNCDAIEHQLTSLARISKEEGPPSPAVSELYWDRVERQPHSEGSFGESLFSAVSVAQAGFNKEAGWPNVWMTQVASEAAEKALRNWQAILLHARSRWRPEQEDEVGLMETLYSKALPLLINFAAYLGDVPSQQFLGERVLSRLERESRGSVRAYARVKSVLMSPMEFDIQDDLDCAPAAICLGKVLEVELNTSIVQWVRRQLGAEMPRHFCRRVPDGDMTVSVFQNRAAIDLNAGNNRALYKRTIGEVVALCRYLGPKIPIPNEWDPANWSQVTDLFEAIRRVRNRGAHSEQVGPEEVTDMEAAFKALEERGDLLRLLRMKSELRGDRA